MDIYHIDSIPEGMINSNDKKVLLCCLCQNDCRKVINDNDGCSYATIEKRNIFSYAMWGLFEVVNGDIPFDEGFVCNMCLKKYTCKSYKDIECGVCHQLFQNMYGLGMDGGYNCDATISETHISCGYGSCYDGDYIEFINGKPDYLNTGDEICNDCLGKLLEKLKRKNLCKHIEPPIIEYTTFTISADREKQLIETFGQDFVDDMKNRYNHKEDSLSANDQDQNKIEPYGHNYPWKHIFDTKSVKHASKK